MIDFKRLKDIREDNDFNQEEMASILEVKRGTYSLWELGINIIPLRKLIEYADYFNCSIDYVLGLSNKKRLYVLEKGIDFKKIGNNIRALRIKNNLFQENLAELLGVTQACIAKYENNLIEISTSNICKLAKIFKISVDSLCKTRKSEQAFKIKEVSLK